MKNRVLKKQAAVALAAGTLFCSQVWAAEHTVYQLDQITVTAERISQTVGSTPANVTVITSADLQAKGARTLADALMGVSGVSVQSFGGIGEKAIPYILGSDRVVLLIDGKRMNLPQGVGTSSVGIDLNTFKLNDGIERIEIVRGGASALYGADAVGGVINIITKKGEGAAKLTTSAAGGSYGGRSYQIASNGQENNTRWQLSGIQDRTDGQRDNSAYKGKNVSFRLDQDVAKGENLTFTYDYNDSHAGMPGSLAWPSPNDFQDTLRRNWSAGYCKEHADGSRTFRFYSNKQKYSGENYGSDFRHQNNVRAFDYQDNIKVNADSVMTWGGEWRTEKVTSTAEGNTPHESTTKAFFIQNQYSINAAAKLTLGMRRDANSLYGDHWLPKAAYLYQANPSTSYFVNWGKIFKVPKFDDLYGDDGYGNTGNPD